MVTEIELVKYHLSVVIEEVKNAFVPLQNFCTGKENSKSRTTQMGNLIKNPVGISCAISDRLKKQVSTSYCSETMS